MAYAPAKNNIAITISSTPRRIKRVIDKTKLLASVAFYSLIFIVIVMKIATFELIFHDFFFFTYSLAVALYVFSRFGLSYFYSPAASDFDKNYEPTVSFAVPSKNEGEHIRETIMRMVWSNYPKHKFDVIAIDDGSTDNTLAEMLEAKRLAALEGVTVTVIHWDKNQGKREGMAECVKQSQKDILMFVDSDSFVEPDSMRSLIKYFSMPNVAAVAGQAFVANVDTNFLTKMQSVRYYVAFKAYKSAEALFGSVTCCSGCLAAYRRSAILPMMDDFTSQSFLGVRCTYGDDRSLTNRVLKGGYDTVFAPDSIAYTFVPDTFRVFMKQQLRWKKSWLRESFMASLFMWRKNIIMSISFYLGFLLPLAAPIIVFRALFWYPFTTGFIPFYYLTGLLLMAVIYGLYYYRYTGDKNWFYGVIFTTFYTMVLMWQLPYALLKIRDSQWGTR